MTPPTTAADPEVFARYLERTRWFGGKGRPFEIASVRRIGREADLVGLEIVEVAPAYDHAEITAVAASNVAYELVSLMALQGASQLDAVPAGVAQQGAHA